MGGPSTLIRSGMSARIIHFSDPERQKAPGQVASGRKEGWGAAPGRNPATVPAATEAGLGTGTVEPAAGPAESRLLAAGHYDTPGARICSSAPG